MGAELESGNDLQSYFDNSLAALKTGYDRAETTYVRPGMSRLQEAWLTRPMITTFLIVLCSLSVLPVLLFLIFSLAISGIFMIVALGAALAASSIIVAFAGCILACTIGFLFLVSLGVTTFVLSIVWSFGLFSRIRKNGIPEGAVPRIADVRGRVFGMATQSETKAPLEDGHQTNRTSLKSESEWSAVDFSSTADDKDHRPFAE